MWTLRDYPGNDARVYLAMHGDIIKLSEDDGVLVSYFKTLDLSIESCDLFVHACFTADKKSKRKILKDLDIIYNNTNYNKNDIFQQLFQLWFKSDLII